MIKYTGIDISKATFDAAFLAEDGRISHRSFSNSEAGFVQLMDHLSEGDQVTMEASGPYYMQLAYYLHSQGVRVSVVNPLSIRRFCQMKLTRSKTDKKDAEMIALFSRQEKPPEWQPEDASVMKLRQLSTVIEQLDKQITALKNQLDALSRMPVIEAEVLASIRRLIAELEKEKKQLEKKSQEMIEEKYKESYQSLTSIPGIGPKAASMLIMITGNFTKFDNYRQLVAYVGLSPRIFESGTSVRGRGHICKMGMSRLRKILYLCSWSAKRFNSHCREFYERLKSKGKPERVIKIAIAHKLLRQAFAIAKSLRTFDEQYQTPLAF